MSKEFEGREPSQHKKLLQFIDEIMGNKNPIIDVLLGSVIGSIVFISDRIIALKRAAPHGNSKNKPAEEKNAQK